MWESPLARRRIADTRASNRSFFPLWYWLRIDPGADAPQVQSRDSNFAVVTDEHRNVPQHLSTLVYGLCETAQMLRVHRYKLKILGE